MAFTPGSPSPSTATGRSRNDAPAPALRAFASPLVLLAVMWVLQVVNTVVVGGLNRFGEQAWRFSSLPGILVSPVLHASWAHLIANTLPFVILGCLTAAFGVRRFWFVTAVVTVVSGLFAFTLSLPGTVTVGASGLVFGYFGFLCVSVFSVRGLKSRLLYGGIALVVLVVFDFSMLSGLIPQIGRVSWQAHLGGLLGGALAAWWCARAGSQKHARPRVVD